jgi:hypothetical protein
MLQRQGVLSAGFCMYKRLKKSAHLPMVQGRTALAPGLEESSPPDTAGPCAVLKKSRLPGETEQRAEISYCQS